MGHEHLSHARCPGVSRQINEGAGLARRLWEGRTDEIGVSMEDGGQFGIRDGCPFLRRHLLKGAPFDEQADGRKVGELAQKPKIHLGGVVGMQGGTVQGIKRLHHLSTHVGIVA